MTQNIGSQPPLIDCSNVGKVWIDARGASFAALENVNLQVARGEFVVLLGPSGCGKSTLLYMIAGLEPVSTGTIRCGGAAVARPGTDRGFVFQEASLYPWLTVAENVAFGLKMQGMSKEQRLKRAQAILQNVGLADAADKRPDQLSGGMRQRVAMARALALNPEALLLDEPFAALDVQTRAKMQDFLIRIWRQTGVSMIFVTHHIDEAVALADRVVVFTARPGGIKEIIPIDLPRPRDPKSPAFHQLSDHLIDLLRDEVDRAFAEQEVG
ncbi:ABC transporter ATP-binding protein [Acerihabitans arboris]|uniref:ATP-binding cassette domain-containing protein n=1 Tax=Acerihabitans arboris TaxID=2691583 RepID=A0A845SPS2_9GAMM|nr:ABC transporter ATP-binding protein [Acerihabitans arboris]NDL65147.1 ATP-binding cassette domain-containing protein [Acerihabitans arboris]